MNKADFTKKLFCLANKYYEELPSSNGKAYQIRNIEFHENWFHDYLGKRRNEPKVAIEIVTSASKILGWENAGIEFSQCYYPNYERGSPEDNRINSLLLDLFDNLPDGKEGTARYYTAKRTATHWGKNISKKLGIDSSSNKIQNDPCFYEELGVCKNAKSVSFDLLPFLDALLKEGLIISQGLEIRDNFRYELLSHGENRIYGGVPNKKVCIKKEDCSAVRHALEFREIPSEATIASLKEIFKELKLELKSNN